MKNSILKFIVTSLALSGIIFLTCLIKSIPWWSFIIPSVLFGLLFPFHKMKFHSFPLGFFSGFSTWLFSSMIIYKVKEANNIVKIGNVFHIPFEAIFLVTAIIGGVLVGLSVYVGSLVVKRN